MLVLWILLISLKQLRPLLVDATRMSDGRLVYIKEVQQATQSYL